MRTFSREGEILRFAQDDSGTLGMTEGAQDDSGMLRMTVGLGAAAEAPEAVPAPGLGAAVAT